MFMLISLDNSREVYIRDYLFIKCDGKDNKIWPLIVRVEKIYPNSQLGAIRYYS
ncbi:hypothetical protein V2W45_1417839 [Cenococcum geophilum]